MCLSYNFQNDIWIIKKSIQTILLEHVYSNTWLKTVNISRQNNTKLSSYKSNKSVKQIH